MSGEAGERAKAVLDEHNMGREGDCWCGDTSDDHSAHVIHMLGLAGVELVLR
jgi:hypothetical protein